jgi:hypothetical protein
MCFTARRVDTKGDIRNAARLLTRTLVMAVLER